METNTTVNGRTLKKLITDRSSIPVIREILDTLLKYITQELPSRTPGSQERPTKKERICMNSMKPVGSNVIRRPTTFQLLRSKFLLASPKPAVTHRREVGSLNLKGFQTTKELDRPISDIGRGVKIGRSRVQGMIAKFAAVEQKERELQTKKMQDAHNFGRQISKSSILHNLMKNVEGLAKVQSRSDLIETKNKNCINTCHARGKKEVNKNQKSQCLGILNKHQHLGILNKQLQQVPVEAHHNTLQAEEGTKCISPEEEVFASEKIMNNNLGVLEASLNQQKKDLNVTQQEVRHGRIEALPFTATVENSHLEIHSELLAMGIPPQPDVWALTTSTGPLREDLEPDENMWVASVLSLDPPHKKWPECTTSKSSEVLPQDKDLWSLDSEIAKNQTGFHADRVVFAPYKKQDSSTETHRDVNCCKSFVHPHDPQHDISVDCHKSSSHQENGKVQYVMEPDLEADQYVAVKPHRSYGSNSLELSMGGLLVEITKPHSIDGDSVSGEITKPHSTDGDSVSGEITKPHSIDGDSVSEEITKPHSTYGDSVSGEITKPHSTDGDSVSGAITKPHSSYGDSVSGEMTKPHSTDDDSLSGAITKPHSTDDDSLSGAIIKPHSTDDDSLSGEIIKPHRTDGHSLSGEITKPQNNDGDGFVQLVESTASYTCPFLLVQQSKSTTLECCEGHVSQHPYQMETPCAENVHLDLFCQDNSDSERDMLNSKNVETGSKTPEEQIPDSDFYSLKTPNSKFSQFISQTKEEDESRPYMRDRPKYRTFNYSDVSARRPFVPMTIRFTDTFNF